MLAPSSGLVEAVVAPETPSRLRQKLERTGYVTGTGQATQGFSGQYCVERTRRVQDRHAPPHIAEHGGSELDRHEIAEAPET